jgi:hypothetical protein
MILYMTMVTITFKTHKVGHQLPGFNNQTMFVQNIKQGDTVYSVIANLNQYRGPDSQIKKIYDVFGAEIPIKSWSLRLANDMSFYIDQPSSFYIN